MPGILPDTGSGGLIIRDGSGVCTAPVNVSNAYCPPAGFTSTCQLTALPNDCTGRIVPAQINAIVSEMLCFAATINPTGTWNCGSLCNLASAFTAWITSAAGLVPDATDTIRGKVALYVAANVPDITNDVDAVTPAALNTTLDNLSIVAAQPATTNNPAIPTDHFGTNAEYLGTPVRWIALTLPGIPGVVLVPSYA